MALKRGTVTLRWYDALLNFYLGPLLLATINPNQAVLGQFIRTQIIARHCFGHMHCLFTEMHTGHISCKKGSELRKKSQVDLSSQNCLTQLQFGY